MMYRIALISIIITLFLIKRYRYNKKQSFDKKKKIKTEIINDILVEQNKKIIEFNNLPNKPNGVYWELYNNKNKKK